MNELIFVPEARADINAAYAWYEDRQPGLGEEFLGCVDVCIQDIYQMPERHPLVYNGYRRSLVRRFPYAVFYEYTAAQVVIYSIFHTSLHPEKWHSRLYRKP